MSVLLLCHLLPAEGFAYHLASTRNNHTCINRRRSQSAWQPCQEELWQAHCQGQEAVSGLRLCAFAVGGQFLELVNLARASIWTAPAARIPKTRNRTGKLMRMRMRRILRRSFASRLHGMQYHGFKSMLRFAGGLLCHASPVVHATSFVSRRSWTGAHPK